MAPPPTHPATRFWDKVSKGAPDECWEWVGARDPNGYGFLYGGKLYGNKRWVKAHRLSWEIHNTPAPEGKHVLHTCDNPPCVNPAHLYVGSQKENNHDRAVRKRGRENRPENHGELHANAKLTEADVRAIIVELQRRPRRSQSSIAEQFGIKQPQVSRIIRHEAWPHLWNDG